MSTDTLELVQEDTHTGEQDACESSYCRDTLHKGTHPDQYFAGQPCGHGLTICADRVIYLRQSLLIRCQVCATVHFAYEITTTPI